MYNILEILLQDKFCIYSRENYCSTYILLCNNFSQTLWLKNNNFIILVESVGQELRKGTMRTAYLCLTKSGALAEEARRLRVTQGLRAEAT